MMGLLIHSPKKVNCNFLCILEMHTSLDKRMRHLNVVTGHGKHSHGGQAKIKPAVIDYLKRNNYM